MVIVNKNLYIESSSLELNNIKNNNNNNNSNIASVNNINIQSSINQAKHQVINQRFQNTHGVELSKYFYSPSIKFKNDLLTKTLKAHHQAFTTSSPNSSSDCTTNLSTNKSLDEDNNINNNNNNITTESKKSASSILFSQSNSSQQSSTLTSSTSSNSTNNSLSSSTSLAFTSSGSSFTASFTSTSPPISSSPLSSSSSSSPTQIIQTISPNTLTNLDFNAMMMMFSNNQTQNQLQNNMMIGSGSSPTNGSLMQQLTNMNTINNSNLSNNSDEHEELLAEMELIERMPTQERLKQAKRRRALQLKKWADYEKNLDDGNPAATHSPNNHFEKSTTANKKEANNQNKNYYNFNNNNNNNINNQFRRSIKFQDHIVLLDAIMRKDYDEIERLLESGVTPNSANEDGLTAIHQCCIDDSAELLRLLIRYGANVNVCDNDLWTPLHAAATCANLEICKILIENKADLLAVNTDGNMPYDICDDEICLEYIESEMASKGVTQQTIDMKRSETEMKMLDDLKEIYLQQLLLINKVTNKPNTINTNSGKFNNDLKNNSFLVYFSNAFVNVKRSNSSLVEQCLDLNAKDNNGATLMHIASANGYNSILEFLLNDCLIAAESGAPILAPSLTCRDNDGWTPLHVATFWGHQKAIEILLENGGDIDLRTNNDETVLELCDDPDVRDFIIQKSKEIDVHHKERQAEARAAAALQIKLQLINSSNNNNNNPRSNNNGINGSNGSIRSNDKSSSYNNVNGNISSSNNSNNNILSSINNSTRSLKRTSTGVSRSSSVRRSSFRDKEKAARKLDTSFKDVLYATEHQETENTIETSNQNSDNKNYLSNEVNFPSKNYNNPSNTTNGNGASDKKHPVPYIINHLKTTAESNGGDFVDYTMLQSNNRQAKITSSLPANQYNLSNNQNVQNASTVVKIINNNNNNVNTPNADIHIYPTPKSINSLTTTSSSLKNNNNNNNSSYQTDDHNNNQLKLNTNTNTTGQIARIISNGSGSFSTIPNNSNQNLLKPNSNLTASSNFSMTSSIVSSTSLPPNNNININQNPNTNRHTSNNDNATKTVSASSIAVIDVKTHQSIKMPNLLDQNNSRVYSPTVKIQQPTFTNSNNSHNKLNSADDDVKHKFISNVIIGAKDTTNEFSDLNNETEQSRFGKCSKCFKCTIM